MVTPKEVSNVIAINFGADNEHILIDGTYSVELSNPNFVQVGAQVAVYNVTSVETCAPPSQLRKINPLRADADSSVSFDVF